MQQFIYSKDDLVGILRNLVQSGEKWEGYKRTVEVADFWNKIVTGKHHNEILLSLKPGEKAEQKDQKVRLYNSRTKSVASKIINQIKEVYRSDNIFNEIYFTEKNDNNSDTVKKIQSDLKNFSGKKTVRQWLRDRFLRLNIIDPNAFIVTNFTDNNTYYPIEVRSKNILSRPDINGVLQYFAFVESATEKVENEGKIKTLTSYKYWIFGHEYAVLFHKAPIGAKGIGTPYDITEANAVTVSTDATKYQWFYSEYKIDAGRVPADCVGYIPDPENDDKTFQSIMYPAEELFKELIWKKASHDIHMAVHGIAQKIAFVPACDFNDKKLGLECTGGRLTNGSTCDQCGGSGQMPFHTSEQDIITITLSKDPTQIWDLSKMYHYQVIPIEIIKLTKEEIQETEKAIPLSIFNTSLIDRGELASPETATKIRTDLNSTNNVLYEFCLADADMYIDIVTQIAIYGNNWRKDLVIDYSYPNDFNLESLFDLFEQSKEALGSGTPAIARSKINGKIIAKLCIDNKQAIHNYETREYWKPFSENFQATLVPEFDRSKILWLYFDQIFRNLEEEGFSNEEKEDIPFSSLPRDKQKELIEKQIDEFLKQYKAAKEAAPPIRVPRPV